MKKEDSEELLLNTHRAVEEDVAFYTDYIKPDKLVILQDGKTGIHHHEEHLFIIVHQLFELQFKQIIYDLRSILKLLQSDEFNFQSAEKSTSRLLRCEKIMKHSLSNFELMETMHPSDFLEFRPYLGNGSGFQSRQFREIEILMGLAKEARLATGTCAMIEEKFGKSEKAIIESFEKEENLKFLTEKWLQQFVVPDKFKREFDKIIKGALDKKIKEAFDKEDLDNAFSEKDVYDNFFGMADVPELNRRWAALYIITYRDYFPVYAKFLDAIIAFEESTLLWRSTHPRMVERMMGSRPGTGGTSGINYLDRTREYRVFTDLWKVRTIILKTTSLPPFSEISS